MNDLIEAGKPEEIILRRDKRAKIIALEKSMYDIPGAQVDTDFDHLINHRFCNGIYLREIHLPKGLLIVAKIHNTEHWSIISKGSVLVLTEWGTEHLVAPVTFVSKRFTKRVVYVYEDTIWTTIHKTDKTDPKELEEELIAKDYSELELREEEALKMLEAA